MSRALSALKKLREEKSAVRRAGPESDLFPPWRQCARNSLVAAFGSASGYVKDFDTIAFEAPAVLVTRAKKAARKAIEQDQQKKVTKIGGLTLPLEQARRRHFEQAVERAAELMLTAIIELERQS